MGLESIHFGLKCLGWFGILAVAFSTIGLQVTTAKLESFKTQKIDDLITGKNLLIEKVDDYQKQLEEKQIQIDMLSRKAQNAERGIHNSYDFDGVCRSGSAGEVTALIGAETAMFQELCTLNNSERWNDLAIYASSIIESGTEWLTPSYMRAIAYANLGYLQDAEKGLKYVISKAGDRPEYSEAASILLQVQESRRQQGDVDK